MTQVAKAALTLSHINAIPEIVFSVYNAMLGKEKLSLGDNTIVALLIVKGGFHIIDLSNYELEKSSCELQMSSCELEKSSCELQMSSW